MMRWYGLRWILNDKMFCSLWPTLWLIQITLRKNKYLPRHIQIMILWSPLCVSYILPSLLSQTFFQLWGGLLCLKVQLSPRRVSVRVVGLQISHILSTSHYGSPSGNSSTRHGRDYPHKRNYEPSRMDQDSSHVTSSRRGRGHYLLHDLSKLEGKHLALSRGLGTNKTLEKASCQVGRIYFIHLAQEKAQFEAQKGKQNMITGVLRAHGPTCEVSKRLSCVWTWGVGILRKILSKRKIKIQTLYFFKKLWVLGKLSLTISKTISLVGISPF
jgi:hypothetical protein